MQHSLSSSLYPPNPISLYLYPRPFPFSGGPLLPSVGPCLATAASANTARNPYQSRQRSAKIRAAGGRVLPKEFAIFPPLLKLRKRQLQTTTVAENLGDSGWDSDGVGEGSRRHLQSLSCQQKPPLHPYFTFRKLLYSSGGGEESNINSALLKLRNKRKINGISSTIFPSKRKR